MFVPLHTKSAFSLGYGTASVDELVRRTAELGYRALALTDVENLYGQIQFHYAAQHYGIKAITGVELRAGYGPHALGQTTGRLILLARDRTGYESICRIISRRRTGLRSPDDPLRCLDAEPRGLFFLSEEASALEALLRAGVASDDLRFLLVRPGAGEAPEGIKSVADPDVVMANPGDRELHALMMAIRRQQPVSRIKDAEPAERCLPSAESLRRLFHAAPEALAEAGHVAEACSLDLTNMPPILPRLELRAGQCADARLEKICRQRLEKEQRRGTCLIAASRRLATKAGEIMQFVTLEDEYGLIETVLFPGAYAVLADPVTNPGPFLLTGQVGENHGDIHLVIREVMPFHRRARPYGK